MVMAVAQERITQKGTTNSVSWPESTSTRVMMPMDFWASLAPWEKASQAEVNHWLRRKVRLALGRARLSRLALAFYRV